MSTKTAVFDNIRQELKKIIVGQDEVVDLLLITILAEGHAIIEGVPGLAKTLIVNSLARTLGLSFNRIQFTPDMVPSDITGTEILNTSGSAKEFRFIKGPVFSNIILADEINRTPPKTQSALLQSMQEREVTILGQTYELPSPFIVLATQNPIEYEGTYPLPEAQLDRFLTYIYMDYPSHEEEIDIVDIDPRGVDAINEVTSHAELTQLTKEAKEIPVSRKIKEYVVSMVRNTRPAHTNVSAVKEYIEWGAGPRASQMLVKAAQAFCLIKNKEIVDKECVDEVLFPVLKHRVILNYNATAEGIRFEDILEECKKASEVSL